MNPARAKRADYRTRTRAAQAKAGRREALGSAVAPVAFRQDAESAHAIDTNPNRGKNHASRANLNLSDLASAQRNRTSRNEGRRKRGESCRMTYLETSFACIPSLPPILSKRVPRS